MNRKGEVTSTQIVTLAIAIIGFIVVLILLWSLEFESYSDEEICRLSILSRATGGGTFGGLVPLKCTTKKICITADGKCEQFAGEKEGDIIKVKVGNGPIKDAEIIAKANADAMYDCWTMMGEGNLDLFQGGKESEQGFLSLFPAINKLEEASTSCVICSRVAIDRDLIRGEKYFSEVRESLDVNEYILEESAPDGKKYIDVFAKGKGVSAYPVEFKKSFGSESEEDTDEVAFVFFQILTPDEWWEQGAKAGIVAGSTVFAGSSVLGAGGIKERLALSSVAGLAAGGIASLQQVRSQQVSARYCGPFSSKEGTAKRGCSLLLPLDYNNVDVINNYCSRIEGNP